MSSDRAPPPPKQDILFVHSPTSEGEGYHVIRKRDETVELGELRAVQEGRPIHGDMVKLKPRSDHDRLFDVEVLATREELGQSSARAHVGPPQVATEAYRSGWEAIFGAAPKADLPN